MTPAALVDLLRRRGVVLVPIPGGRLRYRGPPGAMTLELRTALQARKDAVLQLLLDRRRAFAAWEAAMSEVADAWDRHAREAWAAGRPPAWLEDGDLSAAVRAAITAGDVAGTREAAAAWRAEWLQLLSEPREPGEDQE